MQSALHRIEAYPPDLAAPILAGYPAMKFGHRDSVQRFAERLVPPALRMLAAAPAEPGGWVLSSPPLQALPCGANLLCRALAGLLAEAMPDGRAPRFETIRVEGRRLPIASPAEFAFYHEYSKLDAETRRQVHLKRQGGVSYDLAGFAGRHVLFVNDIDVTGNQLDRIGELLHRAGARSLSVLLILQVDRRIGLAFPQIENEINTSRLAGAREFVAFLRDEAYEPTGKLIARLMSHDTAELEAMLDMLPTARRRILHRATRQEEIYDGPYFAEKLKIVERAASASDTGSSTSMPSAATSSGPPSTPARRP